MKRRSTGTLQCRSRCVAVRSGSRRKQLSGDRFAMQMEHPPLKCHCSADHVVSPGLGSNESLTDLRSCQIKYVISSCVTRINEGMFNRQRQKKWSSLRNRNRCQSRSLGVPIGGSKDSMNWGVRE